MEAPGTTPLAAVDPTESLLPHEKLDAYQTIMALDALVVDVTRRIARGHAWLVDQLERATQSAALNLVEANGRTGADRLQHLRIARGSAFEADAAFELLAHRRLVSAEERRRAHALVDRFSRMVTGLSKNRR